MNLGTEGVEGRSIMRGWTIRGYGFREAVES